MVEYTDYNNQDVVYEPNIDNRTLNVADRIKELKELVKGIVDDDNTEKSELERAINKLETELSTMIGKVGNVQQGHTVSEDISTISQSIDTLSDSVSAIGPKHVYNKDDIEGLSGTTAITTSTLCDTLKNSLNKGDIFIGEVNISDGPAGASEHLGILAYATADNITDGESVYSRIYMLATEKVVAPYFWYYNYNEWRSIMLMEDYENFKMKSSTEGSTKKFEITIDDSGTLSAHEIITV